MDSVHLFSNLENHESMVSPRGKASNDYNAYPSAQSFFPTGYDTYTTEMQNESIPAGDPADIFFSSSVLDRDPSPAIKKVKDPPPYNDQEHESNSSQLQTQDPREEVKQEEVNFVDHVSDEEFIEDMDESEATLVDDEKAPEPRTEHSVHYQALAAQNQEHQQVDAQISIFRFFFEGQEFTLPDGTSVSFLDIVASQTGVHTVGHPISLSIDEVIRLYTEQAVTSYERPLNHIVFKKLKQYTKLSVFKKVFPEEAKDNYIKEELERIHELARPQRRPSLENAIISQVMGNFTADTMRDFMENGELRNAFLFLAPFIINMPYDLTYKRGVREFSQEDYEAQISKLTDLARLFKVKNVANP